MSQKPGESARRYIDRVKTLAANIPDLPPVMAVYRFTQGIRDPAIQTEVRRARPRDLAEATDAMSAACFTMYARKDTDGV